MPVSSAGAALLNARLAAESVSSDMASGSSGAEVAASGCWNVDKPREMARTCPKPRKAGSSGDWSQRGTRASEREGECAMDKPTFNWSVVDDLNLKVLIVRYQGEIVIVTPDLHLARL